MPLLTMLKRCRTWLPLVALVCLAVAVGPKLGEAGEAWSRANGLALAAAAILATAYRWVNAGIWAWILESLGHPLPFTRAADLWLMSESLRWVPGGLWGFAARVESAHEAGVPRVVATVSLVVELMVTVLSWAFLAFAAGSGVWVMLAGRAPAWLPVVLLGVVGLGLIAVLVFHRRPGRIGDGLRALTEAARRRPRILLRALLAYTALNALNGFCFWLVLGALDPAMRVDPGLAIASNSAGWLIGFFSFAVPGGIGVRELGSAALLSTVLPWREAALAALVWRLLQIVAELASLIPPALNHYRFGCGLRRRTDKSGAHSDVDEPKSLSRSRSA